MTKTRIVIADDHPMMREALVTALEDETSFEIVGEAANGFEAIRLAEELKPDIVLIDLLMPGMDGLEAISKLLEIQPEAKILVVTSLEDQEKVIAAVQAGALGYFPKTAPRTFLLEAIHKVADGVPYLPAGIAKKLFRGYPGIENQATCDQSPGNPAHPSTGRNPFPAWRRPIRSRDQRDPASFRSHCALSCT